MSEAGLLEAMTRYVQRRRPEAVAVSGYREYSFNIGYCETCSDLVTEVRMTWHDKGGAPHDFDYDGGLGEFIRELTDDPDQRATFDAVACRVVLLRGLPVAGGWRAAR